MQHIEASDVIRKINTFARYLTEQEAEIEPIIICYHHQQQSAWIR